MGIVRSTGIVDMVADKWMRHLGEEGRMMLKGEY